MFLGGLMVSARSWVARAAIVTVAAIVGVSCSSSSPSRSGAGKDPTSGSCSAKSKVAGKPETLRVPQDHATIQAAVCAAHPGDLVLISKGT